MTWHTTATWFNHEEGILNYKKKNTNCLSQHEKIMLYTSRGDESWRKQNWILRAKNAKQIAWCETSHSVLHINEKSFLFSVRALLLLKDSGWFATVAEIKLEIINLQISANRSFHFSSITFHVSWIIIKNVKKWRKIASSSVESWIFMFQLSRNSSFLQ